MSTFDQNHVLTFSLQHPKSDCSFTYGTAGFRARAEVLDSVMFRMGMLAVLRSKSVNGKSIGVMVTASHNPIRDNGIKLIDPCGEMLIQSWEEQATQLACAKDEHVADCLTAIINAFNIDETVEANVVVAKDTRPSSVALAQSVKDGVLALSGKHSDLGVLTTPQLHYIVNCLNNGGEPTEIGYYQKFAGGFLELRRLTGNHSSDAINVDGANGVGALKIKCLAEYLKDSLPIRVFNETGVLNQDCGADYVKSNQKAPQGMEINAGDRCLSFDGDADRIVYYYVRTDGKFCLLDGDKISVLIALYIKDKLDHLGIELSKGLGVVQTAYANGSSTEYLRKNGVPVEITKTGVKHLHHKALEFDIGVYFEANGHGTVIYSDEAATKINAGCDHLSVAEKDAKHKLKTFMNLTNQVVGDAISDMLLVESILHERKWSCADWNEQYTDLPNKLSKVSVKDRRLLKTNHNETKLLQPILLQEKIDSILRKYPKSRAFVRPSGTEDVVRVYVEAQTQAITEEISSVIEQLVREICE